MTEEIRIFISSPGDVAAERRRAALVIGRLKREFARCFELVAVLWEDEAMRASAHFQDLIEPPAEADIVLVILCSRLGTPLPADRYRGLDGRIPVTGTEWEFENALQASLAHHVPDLLVYRKPAELAAVPVGFDQLDAAKAQLALLEGFWRRYFVDPAGGFKLAFNTFRTLDEFEDEWEQDLRTLLRDKARKQHPEQRIAWYGGSPFRGLQVFETEHAAIFFGRARAEQDVVEALVRRAAAGTAFVLVLGASGSGKSSLVRAGVLPQLREPGVVERVELWRRCVFKPSDAKGDLFAGLAQALTEQEEALPELAAAAGTGRSELAAQLRTAATLPLGLALRQAVEAARPAGAPVPEARLVLLVDQMEELFTLREITAEQRRAFMALLAALAKSGAVWVLGTMRSDFYHCCAELPELVALTAGEGQYHLTPPGTAELEQMIRQPAAAAGIGFEAQAETGIGLDAVLLEAASGGAAVLPLLEFTLDELYRKDIEQGGGTVLTYASYQALGGEEGGLGGAIVRRAEEVCQALSAQVGKELSGLLRALVAIGEGTGLVTARSVPREELATTPERAALLDVLVRERLLVSGASPEGGAVVRLAHEALLTHWPKLRKLVANDRAFLRLRGRLLADRVRWEEGGRSPDLLLPRGRRVAEAKEVLETQGDEIDPATAAFIRQSVRRDQRSLWWTRAVAAAMTVLAAVLGGVGWYSYDRSVVAEGNFTIALTTADTLVRDVAQGMKNFVGVPADQVRGILEKAEGIFANILKTAGDSPELRYRQAVMLNTFADVYTSLGDTAEAMQRAETARSLLDDLTAAEPDKVDRQRELGISHARIGAVLETGGDPAGALTAYHAAQGIFADLVARDASRTDWQRDLAATDDRIGGVLLAAGDLDGALEAFRSGQAVLNRSLTDRDPNSAEWQHMLAVSNNRIGGVLQVEGDHTGALEAFRKGLSILELLVVQMPGRADWQRDLAISHNSIGGFLRQQGDLAGALKAYRDGLAIYQHLTTQDPGRVDWQRELALNESWVGDILQAKGDLAGALEAYRAGQAILERAAGQHPSHEGVQGELAVSAGWIGDILHLQGDHTGALEAYRKGQAILQRLTEQHPDNPGWGHDLAVCDERIGTVLGAADDRDGALEGYRAALAVFVRLAVAEPDNPLWQRGLAGTHDAIGDLLSAGGDPDRALEAYGTALAITERLVAREPDNAGWQRDLSMLNERVGDVLSRKGNLTMALESYHAAQAITASLVVRRD